MAVLWPGRAWGQTPICDLCPILSSGASESLELGPEQRTEEAFIHSFFHSFVHCINTSRDTAVGVSLSVEEYVRQYVRACL